MVLALLASAAVAPAAPAAMIAQWRFDELSGQAALDDGPFALHGELGDTSAPDGADPPRVAGQSGGALRFDGTSLVRLPTSAALAPEALTAEAVVRAGAVPGAFRYVMSRGASGCVAGAYGLYTAAAGGIALYVFDGSRYSVSATARPEDVWDGGWHHVAGTFDGAALRLYVDGRPVGDPMPAPLRIDYAGTSPSARIGQYGGDCDLAFSGDIDLVRLSSHALAPAEVEEAAKPVAPGAPTTPLPAASGGTTIAGPPTRDMTSPNRSPKPSRPGLPRRCAVRVARKRVAPGPRVVVKARVARLGPERRAARLVARRAGKHRALSSAPIGARGRARLVLDVRRGTKLELRVRRRPRCAPAYVTVR